MQKGQFEDSCLNDELTVAIVVNYFYVTQNFPWGVAKR